MDYVVFGCGLALGCSVGYFVATFGFYRGAFRAFDDINGGISDVFNALNSLEATIEGRKGKEIQIANKAQADAEMAELGLQAKQVWDGQGTTGEKATAMGALLLQKPAVAMKIFKSLGIKL